MALQVATAQLAADLQLQLPLINATALLERFARDLGMPQVSSAPSWTVHPAIGRAACELCCPLCSHRPLSCMQVVVPAAAMVTEIHCSQGCALQMMTGASSQPHAHVMAALVVAVKLLYGLDGVTRRLPAGVPPPPDWLAWAAAALRHASQPSLTSLLSSEVSFWHSASLLP